MKIHAGEAQVLDRQRAEPGQRRSASMRAGRTASSSAAYFFPIALQCSCVGAAALEAAAGRAPRRDSPARGSAGRSPRAGPPPRGAASPPAPARGGPAGRDGAPGTGGSPRRARRPPRRRRWRSFSAVIGSPYWKRDDRHAKEGLSQVGSPSSLESSRISSFHSAASISGARTPRASRGLHAGPVIAQVVHVGAVDELRGALALARSARAARTAPPCRRSTGRRRCARTRAWPARAVRTTSWRMPSSAASRRVSASSAAG